MNSIKHLRTFNSVLISMIISMLVPDHVLSQDTPRAGDAPLSEAVQAKTNGPVRLRIRSAINQFNDETMVVFSAGTSGMDVEDVPKFVFAHPAAPQIATTTDGTVILVINAFGPYTTDISIPVLVNVAVTGDYTITATGLNTMGLSCLRLEDLATGVITPLHEGATYTFAALDTDEWTTPRMLLHASAPLVLSSVDPSCHGRDDGSASVQVITGPVDIQWMAQDGVVLLDQVNTPAGPSTLVAVEAGAYSVSITSATGCGTLIDDITIDEPSALELSAHVSPTSCPESVDGFIQLSTVGGEAPYTYLWNTGSQDPALEGAAGTYNVMVFDANGCELASQEYVVTSGEGPEAGISVETNSVVVGQGITFYSASDTTSAHHWDFGDGSTSVTVEPVHVFELPGTYVVILEVDNGICTTTNSLTMIVESTTGISTMVGATCNAWVSGDQFVVDHDFSEAGPIDIRILSTNGQLLQQHRFSPAPSRITLSNAALTTGIYLVHIGGGSRIRTFALPVVR